MEIIGTYPNVVGFFYDWGDDPECYHCGQKACPRERRWGTIDSQRRPKQVYDTFKPMAHELF